MSVLGALALTFGPSLINAGLRRRGDRALNENVENFYGGLRTDARAQMDESMASREAAKKDIGVGDTYKKYLDMAMQDPMADFQRKEAMRNQAESLGALRSGGARALLGGLGATQARTANQMERIAAGEQSRKLGALQTFGGIEQQQENMRIREMLRDARGDLGLARTQYGDATLGERQAQLMDMQSQQAFRQGLTSSLFDGLTTLNDENENFLGGIFNMPNGEKGMKLPGEFSHDTNPIDLMQSGEKVGEATGDEYIVNPEQARKISKESKFARQLFKKFEKRARS
tara:strand:+ start:858 stop:1718 length:861 start_codon:yes stop_codon:yes gene_type:complete